MIRLSILAPLVTVLTLTALVPEADAGARRSRPVRTGQTTCWDTAGTVIDCAGTGVDGDLRRGEPRCVPGQRRRHDPRQANRADVGEAVRRRLDPRLGQRLPWDEAFEKIDDLNTPPCFAGFCDWRVPNRFELESIVDLGTVGPGGLRAVQHGMHAGLHRAHVQLHLLGGPLVLVVRRGRREHRVGRELLRRLGEPQLPQGDGKLLRSCRARRLVSSIVRQLDRHRHGGECAICAPA